jgi:1-aminocyclopropane-1-carboxylate deaminase/D-cysteine desulfhydrase-like pyridoxal-dependent ACC family enzyme
LTNNKLNCCENKQERFMPQSIISEILKEFILKEPQITELTSEDYENRHIKIFMLRLDEVHPVISGNKLFKLCYFLELAKKSFHKNIITFGGAYSNHLAATAFACKEAGLNCLGIIRGEMPDKLSHTLMFCIDQGMKLEFVSRSAYKKINEEEFTEGLKNKYGEHILIPEGGFSIMGKKGAALINRYFSDKNFTHICLPVGTATTFAGILDSNTDQSEIIGFSVLKDLKDISKRFSDLKVNHAKKYSLVGNYHFGGYAKKTNELISFMNNFYKQHEIPLDFVYTGKMMFGVDDLICKMYFPAGSQILCIHTGGLQGNNSLKESTLIY